jgi:hypothetical protein
MIETDMENERLDSEGMGCGRPPSSQKEDGISPLSHSDRPIVVARVSEKHAVVVQTSWHGEAVVSVYP